MAFQDRNIECIDCHASFVFTAGEQEFYDRKGFKEVPKRCKDCRDKRKARRDGDGGGERASGGSGGGAGSGGSAGYGGGGNGGYGAGGGYGGGGNGGYGGGAGHAGGGGGGNNLSDDYGNRAAAPAQRNGGASVPGVGGAGNQREFFDALCAACGAPARVPFRPAAGRPVYCRDCYATRSSGGY